MNPGYLSPRARIEALERRLLQAKAYQFDAPKGDIFWQIQIDAMTTRLRYLRGAVARLSGQPA